ncbi:MAG: Oxidoreductase, short chain dehydrogenase/reductase [Candidatus Nomurabacteria bacterium GW2011_GWF2_43_8]|uniref:Oxidoreductase, short chain dehydrogenase/reductase n=2 Tax=Candidatus Nomuraibacteriota TaxID=1752729 RepID=A0A0G1HXU3_9BACT|nr:MAG: Oxidoreductase, short chain dehydrogenase/reductase [Candidatus Nomurabacteria bacterium GW2011_GWA2_43_15]KKT24457.1 MAG: Oxidoreductase, short chain dehydrogenase/reductase [Candidatus Nomurabacteria bacterium GW2011_GWF2_43_8]
MKTVLITGISRGIGKALAQKFLSEGCFVIGTSTSGSSNLNDKNLITLQLDLSSSESIKVCAEKVKALNKPIDILINNAGIFLPQKYDSTFEVGPIRQVMEVNLFGTIDFTERIVSQLAQGSHVINISSRQGSMSHPISGQSHVGLKISKAALNMFTRILSYQLKDKATVSSVHPGAVKSGGTMAPPDADMEPEEAARYIYDLAISKPETGQFWFKGKKFPW